MSRPFNSGPDPAKGLVPVSAFLDMHAPVYTRLAVMCWMQDAIEAFPSGDRDVIGYVRLESGHVPIWQVGEEEPVLLVNPGVGAPLAAWFIESLVALGCRTIIGCGVAGCLEPIPPGMFCLLRGALRGDGTSAHYHDAQTNLAKPSALLNLQVENSLRQRGVQYRVEMTWTTDAIFRETEHKIHTARTWSARLVEMEAAACFDAAAYHGVDYAQLVYAGDDASSTVWSEREWFNFKIRRALLTEALVALRSGFDSAPSALQEDFDSEIGGSESALLGGTE